MLLEILVILLSSLIFWFLQDRWKSSSRRLPPGPLRFPLIGNITQLAQYKKVLPYTALELLSKKYGSVMSIKFGIVQQTVVHDYETMKEILCSDSWVDRYFDDFLAGRSFGKSLGIIFISGGVWKEMRRFSMRTLRDFGFGKQKSMESFLTDEINDLMQNVEKSFEKGKDRSQPICMKQFFTVSVLNILWTMIAGYRFSPDDKRLQDLINVLDAMARSNPIGSNIEMAWPIFKYIVPFTARGRLRKEFITKMHLYFTDILNERRALGRYKDEQLDFIDVFLKEIDNHKEDNKEPNYYTDEQFIIVCLDLFAAGSETTSNTMEFAMLYMILNPQVQVKVQEEIDQVVGRSRLPNTLDRPQMPYSEATLLEVQRMANVLPLIVRGASQATRLGQYEIPKGNVAILNTYSMHLSEKIWGDPLVFRPERFLDEQRNIINAHKILPFGLGKRVCLGEVLAKASMFSFFTSLLQRYTFEKSSDHSDPTSEPHIGFTLTPQPYHVTISRR